MWTAIGRQLRCPSGRAGWIAGHLMTAINRQPVMRAVEALDPQPAESVLELGFGSGFGLALLAGRIGTGRVCGVDRSAEMVALARRRNRAAIAAGRMQIGEGGFSPLAWPDDTFDAVLAVNVIYFFDAACNDIAEVRRVLRPGGRVALYATDRSTMESWPFCEPETHRLFDRSQVEALLMQGGFARDAIRIAPCPLALGIDGILAVARKA